jgi:hypothetical protein
MSITHRAHALEALLVADGLELGRKLERGIGDLVGLAGGVELLEFSLFQVQQVEQFVVDGRLVERQHVERGAAVGHLVFLRQVDVVAEQEVLAFGRQRVAQDFGHIFQVLEREQIAGEERQLGVPGLGRRHHLVASEFRRAGFIGELGREAQGEFAAEADASRLVRRSFKNGVEQSPLGFEAGESGAGKAWFWE